jgi:hypothetical protein
VQSTAEAVKTEDALASALDHVAVTKIRAMASVLSFMIEGNPPPALLANYIIAFQHYAQWSLLANDGMCLLVTRVYQITGVPISVAWDWQELIMASLLISQQIIDDIPLSNSEFPKLYAMVLADTGQTPRDEAFTLQELNQLEVRLLKCLKFQIHMPTAALLQVDEVLAAASDTPHPNRTTSRLTPPTMRPLSP